MRVMGNGGSMLGVKTCLLKHVVRRTERTGRTEAKGVGEWRCTRKKGFNSRLVNSYAVPG